MTLTGIGLALALAMLTRVTGQIENAAEAVALGALSGLAIGALQAIVLRAERIENSWVWLFATSVACALGWLVTSSAGIALAPGWPVYGLSGAIVSQVITAVIVWRIVRRRLAIPA